MSSEVVGMFAYIFWSIAGVFTILSVFLFFKLRVKVIVDDLSGKKAAREIRAYREKHVYTEFSELKESDTYTTSLNPAFISTTMLVQGTEVLSETDILLNEDNETGTLESNLILDEMVIHTMERI